MSFDAVGDGIIARVNWVTANHVKPAVANMSLGNLCGTAPSTAVDNAVTNSVNAGVTYTVSAGNCVEDACNYSPESYSGRRRVY